MGLAASLLRCFRFPRCLVLRAAGAGFGWLPRCCAGVVCFQLYGCGLPLGVLPVATLVRCLGSGFGCCGASVLLSAGLRLLRLGGVLPAVVLLVCALAVLLLSAARRAVVGASVLIAAWLGCSSDVAVVVVSAVRVSGFVCLLICCSSSVVRLSGVRWLRCSWLPVLAVLRWVLCLDRFGWRCFGAVCCGRSCCAGVRWSAGCRWCFGAVAAGWLLLAVVSVSYDTGKRK